MIEPMSKLELKAQAQKYKLCYKLYFKKASDATRAKLLTLREDPDNKLTNDDDVKEFLKNVIDLAEHED